jgi:oxygen-independent coproporphyrinogen-3 oxidase
MHEEIPLSLYVHIPWCQKKCPYCDFNSHTIETNLPEARYVESLIKDLEWDKKLSQGRKINTIFLAVGLQAFSPQRVSVES